MSSDEVHALMAGWANGLPEDQVAALRRWQSTDRHYELIQRALRRGLSAIDASHRAEVVRDVRLIDQAVRSGRIPISVVAYRGVRSVENALGMDWRGLEGTTFQSSGFMAMTTERAQVQDFLQPEGLGGAAMLVIDVPAGTPAASLAAAGHAAQREQAELLLPEGIGIVVRRIDTGAVPPAIRCEVRRP